MENVPCTYRVSVKAVIKDVEGRVLLLRESDGSWELPGGGLEHGEDPRAALVREVAEETSLTVTWMDSRPEKFWAIHKQVGSPVLQWFAFVAYQAEVSGKFRLDSTGGEAEEARYFTIEEAKKLQLHDNTKPYFA
ncbi:MAG TPA: NUDIX hydrolase [Candidatus Saccharimonadales bacterium]|nr:NUDIX hydrolase [Candidatus Saccharimonadales bacterium]